MVFGKVRGILSQEERQELADCIASAQQKPVPVILFHAEKESKDTVCRLPNGTMIFIMGQQGAAFRRMREALPTFQNAFAIRRKCKQLSKKRSFLWAHFADSLGRWISRGKED